LHAIVSKFFTILKEALKRSVDWKNKRFPPFSKEQKSLVARRLVYAGDDKIVDPIDFCDDPPAFAIQDVSHTSVCKPRSDLEIP
jgi:hypothetical protein